MGNNGDIEFFRKYGADVSEKDITELSFSPFPNYTIDSVSLFNYQKGISPDNIMNLDKQSSTFYIKKGNEVIMVTRPQKVGDHWDSGSTGPTFPGISAKITELMSNGQEVYNVYVNTFPSHNSRQGYVIYKERKQWYSIQSSGTLKPFEDELLNLKVRTIQADKDWKDQQKLKD